MDLVHTNSNNVYFQLVLLLLECQGRLGQIAHERGIVRHPVSCFSGAKNENEQIINPSPGLKGHLSNGRGLSVRRLY
jgi:hypothetical protein